MRLDEMVLTESKTYKLWESAGHKLVEAQLTADQIDQLFQQVEQGATDAGGNRTLLGKGKDAAEAVNQAWEDLKTKIQTSGPIQNVDAMYDQAAEKLKQATGGDQGVMKYVQKYRDFAKKHPIAQGFIYSALIAAAGISGAGLGGAAASGLFKMADKLLQGEKFSSAAYSGAKTGAIAYAAGQIGQALKGKPEGDVPGAGDVAGAVPPIGPRDVAKNALAIFKEKVANGEVTDYNSYQSAMQDALMQAGGQAGPTTQRMAQQILGMKLDGVAAQAAGGQFSGSGPEKVASIIKALGGTVDQDKMQTAINAATTMRKAMGNESISATGTSLTESQVRLVFSMVNGLPVVLTEGPLDALKGAAGKAMDWAKTKGHNLTTKITADKLRQAWKAAGSPMDSEAVAGILTSAGVDKGIVDSVYKTIGIPTTATPAEPTAPAEPAQATPAPTTTTPAEPTAPTSKPDAKTFAQKILADFNAFADAGGSTGSPVVRQLLKSMWMQAGGLKAESKK